MGDSMPLIISRSRKPGKSTVIPADVIYRARTNITKDIETGCHISNYSVGSHGYAQVGWGSRALGKGATTAHRAVWTHHFGQIPPGMTIDHLCRNRKCVNVEHLRMLNNFENARRTGGRDWPVGECIRGHSNDHLVESSGKLVCAICRRGWQRSYQERKAAPADPTRWRGADVDPFGDV